MTIIEFIARVIWAAIGLVVLLALYGRKTRRVIGCLAEVP